MSFPPYTKVDPCNPPKLEPSRQQAGGPQLVFVTQASQAIGGAIFDIPIDLPFPCCIIAVCSILVPQDSVFLSPQPTGRSNPGLSNAIVALGTEHWFPMTNQPVNTAAPWYWTKLKFKSPIKRIYLSMGNEAGGQNIVTLACGANEDDFEVVGGPWT